MEELYQQADSGELLTKMMSRFRKSRRVQPVSFRSILQSGISPNRYTHQIHPYPAKLLVHIPFFFLANRLLTKPGDTVLDPFCGSGTVLLEGQLSGRLSVGADSNPLARLISEVKTRPLEPERLAQAARELRRRIPKNPVGEMPDVVNIDHWYSPANKQQLQRLANAIELFDDPSTQPFFRVCLSVCARRASLADPRLTVPVRLNHERLLDGRYHSDPAIRSKVLAYTHPSAAPDPITLFWEIVACNIARMERLHRAARWLPATRLVSSDARCLASTGGSLSGGLRASSVDLVITSPPYPGAQKYIRASSLGLGWLRLCATSELAALKRATIGREEFSKRDCDRPPTTGIAPADRLIRQIHRLNPSRAAIAGTYLTEMQTALQEMHRVLKRHAHLVLIVGNSQIAGHGFRTERFLSASAEQIGFSVVLKLVDTIHSRGLMTRRNRTADLISREYVVVLRKE